MKLHVAKALTPDGGFRKDQWCLIQPHPHTAAAIQAEGSEKSPKWPGEQFRFSRNSFKIEETLDVET